MKENAKLSIISNLINQKDFTSGSTIAEKVGVSRVSIWSHLEKLRKEGFEFEASTKKGYKITQLPKHIHETLLQAYLNDINCDAQLFHYPSIDSTNSETERLLATSTSSKTLAITANEQTQGRGRQGRTWDSSNQNNIFLSLGLKLSIPAQNIPSLTPFIALHLAKWIKDTTGVNVKLKWPNDLLINGKKFCGMLAESRVDIDQSRDLIFGIGLNVNTPQNAFPDEIKNRATSLQEETGKPLDINKLCASLINNWQKAIQLFLKNGPKETFESLWPEFNALANKTIQAYQGGQALNGTATGLTPEGMLKFSDTQGKEHILNSAEISLTHKS